MSGNADVDKLVVLISDAAFEAVVEYQKYGQDVPALSCPVVHPLDSATDLIKLRRALRQLEGACRHLYDMLAPPVEYIGKNTMDFGPVLLRTAVNAGIAEILEGRPQGMHLLHIAEATGLPEPKLTQIMRALASRNCFIEVDTDTYANNRISQALFKDSETRSCDYTWLAVTQCHYGLDSYWEFLNNKQVDVADVPDNYKGLWSYARRNSAGELQDSIYTAWGKHVRIYSQVLSPYSTFCDIGSGVGSFSLHLAKLRPDLHITLQDQPHVLDDALQLWSKEFPDCTLDKRVVFEPLDFLVHPPVQGQDYYYMRAIVHNWTDNDVRRILTNVRKAMGAHSRLLIQEYSLAPQNRKRGAGEAARYGIQQAPEPLLPNFGWGASRRHNLDFTMQLTFNAKERTVGELIELASSAELAFVKFLDLGTASVLEFQSARKDESSQSRL
ncbi:S-adenosyl-L-methionine-dependent methyltransferase [Coniophora puteana RWD-64-598 SS2]|uniref:S-adenosyl-L-methionine-dependent methyltransferase n=1 Tax=Coniophora puteana (strain RWD-64-598) TaxID=741705 RepID=A0A5M3ME17_CONPW|nr:S-adenosyl-L-methionine-dependent methyltransferase [Coniophora puteana RWD-64-598 SS2]EIW77519.1 S-adenosyl-L-methionine-dependent methyltransferase [Coniophora puteana RWD-64-598 SS2]